eukprot:1777051-Amphidinium_carterae.1
MDSALAESKPPLGMLFDGPCLQLWASPLINAESLELPVYQGELYEVVSTTELPETLYMRAVFGSLKDIKIGSTVKLQSNLIPTSPVQSTFAEALLSLPEEVKTVLSKWMLWAGVGKTGMDMSMAIAMPRHEHGVMWPINADVRRAIAELYTTFVVPLSRSECVYFDMRPTLNNMMKLGTDGAICLVDLDSIEVFSCRYSFLKDGRYPEAGNSYAYTIAQLLAVGYALTLPTKEAAGTFEDLLRSAKDFWANCKDSIDTPGLEEFHAFLMEKGLAESAKAVLGESLGEEELKAAIPRCVPTQCRNALRKWCCVLV